jgi:hypothetical protein
MPVSPEELLEQLRTADDGVGVPLNADNLTAAAKLLVERRIDIERDEGGMLRVRLKR